MSAMDFLDLMPHRIRIRGFTDRDDYGYAEALPEREYACLLDDTVAVQFAQSGAVRIPERVAYVMPYPLVGGVFSTVAVPIKSDETLVMADDTEHEIKSIATHYDETGLPHNLEVRFN